MQRVNQLINNFETMPNCLGKEFTHYWIRDFEEYIVSFLII